jgi:hypothetical protein
MAAFRLERRTGTLAGEEFAMSKHKTSADVLDAV